MKGKLAVALRRFIAALVEHATNSTMPVAVTRQCIMAKLGVPCLPSETRLTPPGPA
jgi:hypothetical protein